MGRALKCGAANVLINGPDLYRSVAGSPALFFKMDCLTFRGPS
jgi:hypothetical protein